MKKRVLIGLFSAVIFITAALSLSSLVYAGEIKHITVLGDSIAEGYGLDENDKNYGSWLGEYYGAEVKNFALSGDTTQDLLDKLETNTEISESVENSDLICVSIGGNDILGLFFDDLVSLASSYNASGEINISSEMVERIIVSISTALGPASVNAGKNIGVITEKLMNVNPNARLVLQTVYNPFETDQKDFKNIFSPLHTFTSIYLAAINNSVLTSRGVITADIHKKFTGSCQALTNIDQLDIHPNKLGHLMIAEEIVQDIRLPGENMLFAQELENMLPSDSEEIPQELKNEIDMLSKGVFRAEDIAVAASTAESITETIPSETVETSSNSSTVESSSEYTDMADDSDEKFDPDKGNMSGVIVNIFLLIMVAVILIIGIRDYKKKHKRTGEDKK